MKWGKESVLGALKLDCVRADQGERQCQTEKWQCHFEGVSVPISGMSVMHSVPVIANSRFDGKTVL